MIFYVDSDMSAILARHATNWRVTGTASAGANHPTATTSPAKTIGFVSMGIVDAST